MFSGSLIFQFKIRYMNEYNVLATHAGVDEEDLWWAVCLRRL